MEAPVSRQKLSIGMRVGYQGGSWQVTEIDGFQVKLANTSGQTEVLPFYQFVTLPSVQRLADERQRQAPAATSLGEQLDAYFTTLSEPVKASALAYARPFWPDALDLSGHLRSIELATQAR